MTYLLGTESWLSVMMAPSAYPPSDHPPASHQAAQAVREWAEHVADDLIHMSIVTYGELRLIRESAAGNVVLLYQLQGALDALEGTLGEDRILDLTKEDMVHWAYIHAVTSEDPELQLEDTFVLAQALSQGFTYVGRRTATITQLEIVNLNFLDPEAWLAQRDAG